jgi:hypothetical protein
MAASNPRRLAEHGEVIAGALLGFGSVQPALDVGRRCQDPQSGEEDHRAADAEIGERLLLAGSKQRKDQRQDRYDEEAERDVQHGSPRIFRLLG